MQFMLILAEDPALVVTDEQRQDAVQRVGEYAMSLLNRAVAVAMAAGGQGGMRELSEPQRADLPRRKAD